MPFNFSIYCGGNVLQVFTLYLRDFCLYALIDALLPETHIKSHRDYFHYIHDPVTGKLISSERQWNWEAGQCSDVPAQQLQKSILKCQFIVNLRKIGVK
jgi:hypothetical protein